MSAEIDFTTFLTTVRRHARLFLVVGAAAAVLSMVLSSPGFMPPRYKSSATVYPVNLNSYSIETRTDQLLQLLESNSIRDSLIMKFDLPAKYEIDTTGRGGYWALYNEFKERVEVSKTRLESVQIEVVDEDPVIARDLVLEMLKQVNLLARRLQREKSQEVLAIAERSLSHERKKLDDVEHRLNVLRKEKGLLSYEAQVKELTKGLVRAMTGGSAAQREALQARLGDLEEKGGEFRELTELSNLFRQNYDRALTEYERVVNDVTKELTYTNVVVYPEVSDKKVYPVRWLIVSTATLAALFLCFVLLLWRDHRN
ncbi:MAG TPA: Wzz/FepE/Etk N-terminal domain-containing protein [Flavobacteriales bacterium]|nr:Wzz/FepE/Etk N-terminal domain-containing protein [Flavobacteriales bacterium]